MGEGGHWIVGIAKGLFELIHNGENKQIENDELGDEQEQKEEKTAVFGSSVVDHVLHYGVPVLASQASE